MRKGEVNCFVYTFSDCKDLYNNISILLNKIYKCDVTI